MAWKGVRVCSAAGAASEHCSEGRVLEAAGAAFEHCSHAAKGECGVGAANSGQSSFWNWDLCAHPIWASQAFCEGICGVFEACCAAGHLHLRGAVDVLMAAK